MSNGHPHVPQSVKDLEKFWFLNGFLHMEAILPPVQGDLMGKGSATAAEPVAPRAEGEEEESESDVEAETLLFGHHVAEATAKDEGHQRGWREMAKFSFQPDEDLHRHLDQIIHEMEEHESEFLDPMHRPWSPSEFLKTIENYIKMRCREDMNHCHTCGQANPSEFADCLKCHTVLDKDAMEEALEGGTLLGAMELEGFRILPSPCIKFFLLCEKDPATPGWLEEFKTILRPLYFLFTKSRFLAADLVRETTEHHSQASADLNNLNRTLAGCLAQGKVVVEEIQADAERGGIEDIEDIEQHWARLAAATLESQQAICLMIDAWEEFEGIKLDKWWEDDAHQHDGDPSTQGFDTGAQGIMSPSHMAPSGERR